MYSRAGIGRHTKRLFCPRQTPDRPSPRQCDYGRFRQVYGIRIPKTVPLDDTRDGYVGDIREYECIDSLTTHKGVDEFLGYNYQTRTHVVAPPPGLIAETRTIRTLVGAYGEPVRKTTDSVKRDEFRCNRKQRLSGLVFFFTSISAVRPISSRRSRTPFYSSTSSHVLGDVIARFP